MEEKGVLEQNLFNLSFQKCPDVHKIVLCIKLRSPPPPGKSVNLEDFLLICTVFHILVFFSGGGGGVTKFCRQEFYGHPDFSDHSLCVTTQKKPNHMSAQSFVRKTWVPDHRRDVSFEELLLPYGCWTLGPVWGRAQTKSRREFFDGCFHYLRTVEVFLSLDSSSYSLQVYLSSTGWDP